MISLPFGVVFLKTFTATTNAKKINGSIIYNTMQQLWGKSQKYTEHMNSET